MSGIRRLHIDEIHIYTTCPCGGDIEISYAYGEDEIYDDDDARISGMCNKCGNRVRGQLRIRLGYVYASVPVDE